MELKTCNILGLDILVTDMEKTVNLIEQNIEQLRGKYICVGNVHTTVMAHDDPQYHTVQDQYTLLSLCLFQNCYFPDPFYKDRKYNSQSLLDQLPSSLTSMQPHPGYLP